MLFRSDATPMMRQYLTVKAAHPDHLVFYRMGDFYEMFFEDAVKASAALDIALTKRGQHLGEDIKMCGVPVHSHEAYLSRLIRQGFKVAAFARGFLHVAEQVGRGEGVLHVFAFLSAEGEVLHLLERAHAEQRVAALEDRKSTRLNSSH